MMMHYLIIHYSHPDTMAFRCQLEDLFAPTQDIHVLAASASFRRQEGVVLIAWNGLIDLAFLQQLNSTLDVLDYSIVAAPLQAEGICGAKQAASPVLSPSLRSDEDKEPMVLRGPFPKRWYEEGREY